MCIGFEGMGKNSQVGLTLKLTIHQAWSIFPKKGRLFFLYVIGVAMMIEGKCFKYFFNVIVIVFGLQGCSSNPFNIAPLPPAKYQTLGKATGDACGSLTFT